jgi:hypothetical protein
VGRPYICPEEFRQEAANDQSVGALKSGSEHNRFRRPSALY